jgi:parvulin-like peptidyl-prolyl isomerase
MRRITLFVVLALAAGGCTAVAEAAARVNGEKITQAEVEHELDSLRADQNVREAIRQQGPDLLGQARRLILSDLIVDAVKRQQARDEGVSVTDEDVDRYIQEIEAQTGGRQNFEEALRAQNLTEERLRTMAPRILLEQKLSRAVTEDLEIDEGTVREAYEARKDAFTEYHLKQMVLPSQEEAQSTYEELQAGADFQLLAETRSTSEEIDLGFIQAGQIAQYEQQLQQAPDGGYVGPLQGDAATGSFAIFQVVERRVTPLENVRENLADLLLESQRRERYTTWLEGHVLEADIVVNPKYGRIDERALVGLAQQLGSTQPLSLNLLEPAAGIVR